MVFIPGKVHVSRSLRRTLNAQRFRISTNRAFADVVAGCAARAAGSWMTPRMQAAYQRLHAHGFAKSFEVREAGDIVGWLYGVQTGAVVDGETMFNRGTDATKEDLVRLSYLLYGAGFPRRDGRL